MKKMSRVIILCTLMLIAIMVISPIQVVAVEPMKHSEHNQFYEVNEEDGIVIAGVRTVNVIMNWGEEETHVISMNMAQNFKVYRWDAEAETQSDLLAIIEISVQVHGQVLTDIWFPDESEEDGGMVFDEGVINGHVVLHWHIVPFTGELPEEIMNNLNGIWNLWFKDGIELDRSIRDGELPFGD